MIIALLIGRKGSKGFPKKNIKKYAGKHCFEYPLIAAAKSKYVNKIYINSDIDLIKKFKKKFNLNFLIRKKKLSSRKALGEDVFLDSYEQIKKIEKKIDLLVLLFANAPTIHHEQLDKAIEKIQKDPRADSCISCNVLNMYSPLRARALKGKYLKPFVRFEYFSKNVKTLNCDRDSQGDVIFADGSFAIVRPRVFANMSENLLPMKWMGKKILPFFQEFGLDIDFEWQSPLILSWIKKNFKP